MCQIKTIDGANAVLEDGFVDTLNSKFEKPARNPESAHRPLGDIDLNQILCWEYERQVQHDLTFSFSVKQFQIEKSYGSNVKPKSKIKVRKHLDGTVNAWYNNEKLSFKPIAKRIPTTQNTPSIQPQQSLVVRKVANPSNWHESNSFIFQEDNKTSQQKTTLRKRGS